MSHSDSYESTSKALIDLHYLRQEQCDRENWQILSRMIERQAKRRRLIREATEGLRSKSCEDPGNEGPRGPPEEEP